MEVIRARNNMTVLLNATKRRKTWIAQVYFIFSILEKTLLYFNIINPKKTVQEYVLVLFSVDICSDAVLYKLSQGMSQDPDVAECVAVLHAALSDIGELSEAECNCYLKVSSEQFHIWTGVDASSCGPGSGISFEEERATCEHRKKNRKSK